MTRKDLSPEKQKEFDQITAEMMAEIEAELEKLPPVEPDIFSLLSDRHASVYRRVTKKHMHRLDRLLKGK